MHQVGKHEECIIIIIIIRCTDRHITRSVNLLLLSVIPAGLQIILQSEGLCVIMSAKLDSK